MTATLPSPFSASPRLLRGLLLGLGVLATPGAWAQDLTIKAAPQNEPIAIVNATIHPVSGPAIERGTIVFEHGRIREVGGGGISTSGCRVIDGAGKHIYPGLIGPVTQLGLTEISAVRSMSDHNEVGDVVPEVRAAVAVNPDSTLLPVTRSNGVLAVGVFPTGGIIPGRASVLQLEGWTWEEMAVRQDAGLVLSWPQTRPITTWWMRRSEEDQMRDIRRRLAAIDEVFDIARAYFDARQADPSHPIDLRWEAVRPVFRSGDAQQLPLFIQANDLDQITAAVTWAIRRELRPVIIGGRDAELCADLLTRHDVPVVISGTHAFPKRDDSDYDAAFTLPARLQAAGVRWCLSNNDDTAHERNLPYHAATAVAYGLPVEDAIRSLTLSAAQILGVADRLGSLEPGKHATLILTDGNPLEVTTKVEMAFIQGRQIDLSNKHTRLAEKYREKYRQLPSPGASIGGR